MIRFLIGCRSGGSVRTSQQLPPVRFVRGQGRFRGHPAWDRYPPKQGAIRCLAQGMFFIVFRLLRRPPLKVENHRMCTLLCTPS